MENQDSLGHLVETNKVSIRKANMKRSLKGRTAGRRT